VSSQAAHFTLVTGASSGIGREIALRLSHSRKLILHGRDPNRLNDTRQLCKEPSAHVIWPMDLNEPARIEPVLCELFEKLGLTVDCFIHSAGALKIGPMRNMNHALASELMNVNFFSAAEIIRLLLKRTINKNQLNNIVLVSSTASNFGARGFNLYCASKGALDSLMRALAVELAPEIRVNSVLPGAIRTSMTGSMLNDSQLANRMEADYPLGFGKASDIAAAVEFLVSQDSRWITGQQLIVDGGRTVNISG
jgi:NAD(P)-dependent dehydrogenase (short-subunit alcohol dehydrogenase family)